MKNKNVKILSSVGFGVGSAAAIAAIFTMVIFMMTIKTALTLGYGIPVMGLCGVFLGSTIKIFPITLAVGLYVENKKVDVQTEEQDEEPAI